MTERSCVPSERRMRWWVAFLIGLLFLNARLFAGEPLAAFEQAGKFYEQGKYREAASVYRDLMTEGKLSAALCFNLGNSLFRSGQIGRAIISYRLAEQLSPHDPDIKANLRFARESIEGGKSVRPNAVGRLLNILTVNELTGLASCAIWVWFSLLTVKELWPELANSVRVYGRMAAAACAVLGVWLAVEMSARFRDVPSVVVVAEAVVRYGPLDESQSFFTLRDGSEILVLDQKDNWLQVKDPSNRIGWVRSDQVARVAPESVGAGS